MSLLKCCSSKCVTVCVFVWVPGCRDSGWIITCVKQIILFISSFKKQQYFITAPPQRMGAVKNKMEKKEKQVIKINIYKINICKLIVLCFSIFNLNMLFTIAVPSLTKKVILYLYIFV